MCDSHFTGGVPKVQRHCNRMLRHKFYPKHEDNTYCFPKKGEGQKYKLFKIGHDSWIPKPHEEEQRGTDKECCVERVLSVLCVPPSPIVGAGVGMLFPHLKRMEKGFSAST